jgi:hypothetical protein
MMLKFLIGLSLILSPVLQEKKWVKTKVNDNISFLLPKDFYAMTPEDIAQRYPSVRSPIGAYTNADRLIDVSVKVSATQWAEDDIELASKFFKSSILNLYDQVNFTREEVEMINDKKFAVFEFDTRIAGEEFSLETRQSVRKYNYVQYVIHGGETLVFSLQCPSELREECRAIASRMMASIEVK